MCTGRTHAWGGIVAGLATGILLHKTLPGAAGLAGLGAGMALIPDMDQQSGTASHSLGFLSRFVARGVAAISGGHRRLTHSAAGVAALCGIAWAAVTFRHDWPGRIALVLMVTIAASSALEALGVNGHVADVLGLGAALAVTALGADLSLVLAATAAGATSHLALDAATDRGIPVLLPFSKAVLRALPEPLAWTTGTRPERLFVLPALVVAASVLAVAITVRAADPAMWGMLTAHL
jgi:membrane-bound metal-dependent hydrolase YbcI (DUF457 family)